MKHFELVKDNEKNFHGILAHSMRCLHQSKADRHTGQWFKLREEKIKLFRSVRKIIIGWMSKQGPEEILSSSYFFFFVVAELFWWSAVNWKNFNFSSCLRGFFIFYARSHINYESFALIKFWLRCIPTSILWRKKSQVLAQFWTFRKNSVTFT